MATVPSPRPRPPGVVLVVEDNDDASDIYGASLRHHGFEVMLATTLADARDLARARRPDVVVLDCRLPDGDGIGLLEHWRRAGSPMSKVPVIVVTASGVRQDVNAALAAGADAFVQKPCPGDVLIAYVERAMTGKSPSGEIPKVVP